MRWTCKERTSWGLSREGAAFLAINVTVKGALGKAHHKMVANDAWIQGACTNRLTLLTYRSVVWTNIAMQAVVLERAREVWPSFWHEKSTSLSSTRQALRGNGGIACTRAESNFAACLNERFRPPFFFHRPLPLVLMVWALVNREVTFLNKINVRKFRLACS